MEPTLEEILQEKDNFEDDEFLSELSTLSVTSGHTSPVSTSPSKTDVDSETTEDDLDDGEESVVFEEDKDIIIGEIESSQPKEEHHSEEEDFTEEDSLSLSERKQSILDAVTVESKYIELRENKGITSRLKAEKTVRVAGIATCVSISSKFICIGTSHGYLMLFARTHSNPLSALIGSSEYGAVSSVEVREEEKLEWVLSGYEDGHIMLWDVTSKKLIKAIKTHAHPVLHLRFLNDSTRFISTDSRGVMMLHTVSKMLLMYSIDSRVILNGTAGRIFALAPLPTAAPSALSVYSLVAFTTAKKTHLMSAHSNSAKILYKLAKPGHIRQDTAALPTLRWHPIVRDAEATLAITWQDQIQVLKLKELKGKLHFTKVLDFSIDAEILCADWLEYQALLILDSKEQLRLVEPFSKAVLYTESIKHIELIYHTKFSSSLKLPPQPQQHQSKQLPLSHSHSAPNTSSTAAATKKIKRYCYSNSYVAHNGIIFLLGVKKLWTVHLLSWKERLTLLLNNKHWLAALSLCRDFYQDKVSVYTGLSRELQDRREVISAMILDILYTYIQSPLVTSPVADSADASSTDIVDPLADAEYSRRAIVSIEYCLLIHNAEVLYTEIFEKFKEKHREGALLDALVPYIIDNRVTWLHPEIMQTFVHRFVAKAQPHVIEECILHLNIGSFDFHQIATLCNEYKLFRAMIYLYNTALGDLLTPLENIFQHLSATQQSQPIAAKKTAAVASEYINRCLSHKPTKNTAAATSTDHDQILSFLFRAEKGDKIDDRYDRIAMLLRLDNKGVLAALRVVFEDEYFKSSSPVNRDMVLQLLLHATRGSRNAISHSPEAADYNPFELQHAHLEAIFKMLAVYYIKGKIELSQETIERIFSFLSLENAVDVADNQRVLLLLLDTLHSRHPSLYNFLADKVLLLAEGVEFFKVAEFIYSQQKNFNKVLSCRLKDDDYKLGVFEYIKQLMSSASAEDKQLIKTATIAHLRQLITIDSYSASVLIIQSFTTEHERILRQLDSYPELQYNYLKSIMGTKSISELAEQSGIQITSEMSELYIKLMCKFAPESVYKYLASHDDYPLDSCLKLCKEANITDATAYLLERTGDLGGALDVFLQAVQADLVTLQKSYEAADASPNDSNPNHAQPFPDTPEEKKTVKSLNVCISLCQRNSSRLEDAENELLWFRLLDIVVAPLRKLRAEAKSSAKNETASQRMQQCFTQLMRFLLSSMNGYVALPSILSKIVKDHGGDEFGDFKFIIVDMLDTCNFEKTILQTANRLVQHDMHNGIKEYQRNRSKAFRPKSNLCGVCGVRLASSKRDNPISVYFCGHSYHSVCVEKHNNVCPVCSQSNK